MTPGLLPQNHDSCVCSNDLANVTVTVGGFQNLLRQPSVMENGAAWSNSSESSDDSSSPQLSAGGLCKSINQKVKLLDSVSIRERDESVPGSSLKLFLKELQIL